MNNNMRMASPPAAYAKYLDDFEECEESQVPPVTSKRDMQRNARDYGDDYKQSYNRLPMNEQPDVYSDSVPSQNSYNLMREGFGMDQNSSVQQYSTASNDYYPSYSSYNNDRYRGSDCGNNTVSDDKGRNFSDKPKSIYELKEKRKKSGVKSKKICYAFAKFGDCHYGESCKFSHDPHLLETERGMQAYDERSVYNTTFTENTDVTCRQLEQRLVEIQRELCMLEEESKKPKSSVVVPKRCQLFPSSSDLFASNKHAAFNVGGDFIVRVGNSRSDQNEKQSDHGKASVRAAKRDFPERHSDEKVSKRMRPNTRKSESVDALDVSDDDGIRNNGTCRPKRKCSSKTLSFVEISDSSDDGEVRASTSRVDKKLKRRKLKTNTVPDDSEDSDGELSSGDETTTASEEERNNANQNGGRESSGEPLEFSSVIDSSQLVDISDEEINENFDKPGSCFAKDRPSSSKKEPMACARPNWSKNSKEFFEEEEIAKFIKKIRESDDEGEDLDVDLWDYCEVMDRYGSPESAASAYRFRHPWTFVKDVSEEIEQYEEEIKRNCSACIEKMEEMDRDLL